MAKINHTRNENGQNLTHQNKTTLFWRKKTTINLHQNFPIYGVFKFKYNIRIKEVDNTNDNKQKLSSMVNHRFYFCCKLSFNWNKTFWQILLKANQISSGDPLPTCNTLKFKKIMTFKNKYNLQKLYRFVAIINKGVCPPSKLNYYQTVHILLWKY